MKKKSLKLSTIINIADRVYPDGLVKRASKGEDVGDTLALFIARELKDTYDPKAPALEQLKEARRAIARAHTQLGDVAAEFSDVLGELSFNEFWSNP